MLMTRRTDIFKILNTRKTYTKIIVVIILECIRNMIRADEINNIRIGKTVLANIVFDYV